MTITVGTGPLASEPNGRSNFRIDSPGRKLILEDHPLRLRAVVGGRVVLDSTRATILHETGCQVVPYAPLDEFDSGLLEPSETHTHCPYKGDASYWSVVVGDDRRQDAVWAYEDPLEEAAWLKGLASLRWAAADAWFVEDDEVFGPHLPDPYHRVDIWDTSRPVRVEAAERVIARSTRAKLLFETSLPLRVYIPPADIEPGVLVPSTTRTECPYKGQAKFFSVQAGSTRFADAAWTYESPLREAIGAAGHVCFMGDGIKVDLGQA